MGVRHPFLAQIQAQARLIVSDSAWISIQAVRSKRKARARPRLAFMPLTGRTVAFFVLAATAAGAGIVSPEFGFSAPEGFHRSLLLVVATIGTVYVRFRGFGLVSGHAVHSRKVLFSPILWGQAPGIQHEGPVPGF
jgi:hypothetical protein